MDLIERYKRWKAQGGGMSDSDSEASDSDDSKAASDTDSLAWDLTMKAQTSPVLLDSEFDPEDQSVVSQQQTLDNQSSLDSKNKSSTTNNTPLGQVDTKQIKKESPSKGNRRPGEGISSIPLQSKQIAMNESSSSSSSKKTPQVPPLPKAVPSSSSSDTSLNNKIIQSNEDRTRSKSSGVRSETTNYSQKTTMNDGMKPVTFSQQFLFPSLEEVSHLILLFLFCHL